jgi:hypothetical protein
MNVDMDKIIKQARDQGFRYQRTEKNHHQFYAPDGKTIVTHSATGSDTRGDDNFMADMKRAGYTHGLSSLGEALRAAGTKAPNGGAKLSVAQYALDALSRHPEGLGYADLTAVVRSQRPDVGESALSVALSQMVARGQVQRLGPRGQSTYRLYPLTVMPVTRAALEQPKANGHGTVAVQDAGPVAAPPTVEAGARTGDAAIDSDLEILDRALAALADIEGVVRKNREVLAQLASLKKMLGAS